MDAVASASMAQDVRQNFTAFIELSLVIDRQTRGLVDALLARVFSVVVCFGAAQN
jgi:hypothetical protein